MFELLRGGGGSYRIVLNSIKAKSKVNRKTVGDNESSTSIRSSSSWEYTVQYFG